MLNEIVLFGTAINLVLQRRLVPPKEFDESEIPRLWSMLLGELVERHPRPARLLVGLKLERRFRLANFCVDSATLRESSLR